MDKPTTEQLNFIEEIAALFGVHFHGRTADEAEEFIGRYAEDFGRKKTAGLMMAFGWH